MQLVNPANLDSVKHIKNYGIMLTSNQPESISKIKEVADKTLSSNYDVHVLKTIAPQVKCVGGAR